MPTNNKKTRAHRNSDASKIDRGRAVSGKLLASMASESIAIWRMLGFSDKEILRDIKRAMARNRRRSKYPVRHESKVLDVANALGRWSTDSDYCDERGSPATLKFEGPKPSFASLIDAVSPGFDPAIARDMFLEGSAIHIEKEGSISRVRDFLPVFGGTGSVYSHPVLVCLRSVLRTQARVMTREPAGLPMGGIFATCGARLPRSKWDHFHWQARKIATSVFLLGEWIDANRIAPEEASAFLSEDIVEPVVVLSIEFEGDSAQPLRRAIHSEEQPKAKVDRRSKPKLDLRSESRRTR